MIKRQEISDPNSCLNKAADDEPLFVIRAQDETAPYIVGMWLTNALIGNPTMDPSKVEHARSFIRAAQEWPTRKQPD